MQLLHTILILHSISYVVPQLKPGIRVRLNKGVFEQASTIVAGLVEYEVPRVRIPNSQQCFTEGCVQIHSFRMTSFRQPASVSFQPSPPNRFAIQVNDFDFYVTGQLSGNIQVLIQIPVSGTVFVSGRGISVTAYLDLQKTLGDEPYLRFLECRINSGFIDTKVANMGIFTDTVNSKYRATMSGQSRQQLEEAICNNMHRLSQQHFSTRLSRLPGALAASDLIDMITNEDGGLDLTSQGRGGRRYKREADDYYDEIGGDTVTTKPAHQTRPPLSFDIDDTVDNQDNMALTFTSRDIRNFFNVNRLSHILIDLTLLDAFSSRTEFTVGMAGTVSSAKSPRTTPYDLPFPFRVPENQQKRQVEVAISDYTINSLLYQAHKTNSLLFHVDSSTPGVGTVLKTTCSLDEVCLSDQIEEVGLLYPDQSLELIVRTTSPPMVKFQQDQIMIQLSGRCLFFLEGTRQKVGVIPFDSSLRIRLVTVGNLLKGRVSITRLDLSDSVDFFGLSARDLDGFRSSVQIALEKMTNRILNRGIPLNTNHLRVPLRFSAAHISILEDTMLLQANVDLYNSLYSSNGFN